MDIGITGLGRMGAGMAERWVRNGHRVVAHNRSRGPVDELAGKGAEPAYSIEELVGKLQAPRAMWIMLPAGDVTEQMIQTLIPLLSPGDTIIDGGNTNFNDDMRRADMLKAARAELHRPGHIGRRLGAGEWLLHHGRRRARSW